MNAQDVSSRFVQIKVAKNCSLCFAPSCDVRRLDAGDLGFSAWHHAYLLVETFQLAESLRIQSEGCLA